MLNLNSPLGNYFFILYTLYCTNITQTQPMFRFGKFTARFARGNETPLPKKRGSAWTVRRRRPSPVAETDIGDWSTPLLKRESSSDINIWKKSKLGDTINPIT
jgi:hypothetical protein